MEFKPSVIPIEYIPHFTNPPVSNRKDIVRQKSQVQRTAAVR